MNIPITLTLSPDLAALTQPPPHRLTTRDRAAIAAHLQELGING